MAIKHVTHQNHIYKNEDNVEIPVKIMVAEKRLIEYLWCKSIAANHFLVCCNPFFIYNLALGDEILTKLDEDSTYLIDDIIKKSDNMNYRVFFSRDIKSTKSDKIIEKLKSISPLIEMYDENLLAICIETSQTNKLESFLENQKKIGNLKYERSTEKDELNIKTHQKPIWREHANYLILGKIKHDGPGEIFEQLWVKQLGEKRFKMCCIPFFIFNLALGDEVEAGLDNNNRFTLTKLLERSGHQTFWIWIEESISEDDLKIIEKKITAGGYLFEWYSSELLAVDAASNIQTELLFEILKSEIEHGLLELVSSIE